MPNYAEKIIGDGCGTPFFAIALMNVDNPRIYEIAYKNRGEAGVHEVVDILEGFFKDIPQDVIDNHDKVFNMRQAVVDHFDGEEEQVLQQVATKIAVAFEKRLTLNDGGKDELIDYCVALGGATKACFDAGKILTANIPVIRDIAFRREIKKYGSPQELATPELFKTVVNLVK